VNKYLSSFSEELLKAFPETASAPAKVTDKDSVEAIQIQNYFAGKLWTEIDWDWLNKYIGDPSACLFFMTQEAYIYYLPCYMKVSLLEYDAADVMPYTLLNIFSRFAKDHEDSFCNKLQMLTYKQRKVVATFLQLLSKEYQIKNQDIAAQLALEIYWNKYLSER